MFDSDDDAYHHRRQPKLSKVEGEKGKEAGPGTADQKIKEASESQGAPDVNLLVSPHDGGQSTAFPDRFHMEHLAKRQRDMNMNQAQHNSRMRLTNQIFSND